MRIAAPFFALLLAGCGALFQAGCSPAGHFHMTDISGAMPKLDFHMIRTSDGAAVTGRDYRGKVVALYFGYTNCPDVCPATLGNLTDMIGRVKNPDLRVLFVSVDPVRDTAENLRKYVAAFSPQIEGLRGSANALAELARTYRVAYSVDPMPPYTVMHSNAVFFFDKTGKARLVTTDTSNPAAMAEDVERLLN
jgi:protein SCO1/2